MLTKNTIKKIFTIFAEKIPNPTTELIYTSPFELLIAVILSAQATDISVNKATKDLFLIANSPSKMLTLGLAGLKKYIKSIGLYNTKAENVIKTCEILKTKFHSEVPNTREALQSLPGVGRKTANVILNTLYGEATIAVDTHIFRVANRIGLASGKTPLAVENQLLKVIPREFIQHAHHWLILHGRYTCTARNPKCKECPIQPYCQYYRITFSDLASSKH